MDANGYPESSELKRIREWPYQDAAGLMDFIRSIWWTADWGWKQTGMVFDISTGGWSGNESIIEALQENAMFWILCWWESRRGGHYRFEIPEIK